MEDEYDHELEEAIRLSLMELNAQPTPKPTVFPGSSHPVPQPPPPPPPVPQQTRLNVDDAMDPEMLLAIELSLAEAAEHKKEVAAPHAKGPAAAELGKEGSPGGSEIVMIPKERLRKIKKLKYYYQSHLGVNLTLETNNKDDDSENPHSLKIAARDQLSATIAKNHLEERINTNWSLLEKESSSLKSQHIHVYVDQSHLFYGCQYVSSDGTISGTLRRDPTIGVSCTRLHKFLKKGRNVQEKHVFGSVHPRRGGMIHPKWKVMDYHPILTDQSHQHYHPTNSSSSSSFSQKFTAKDSDAIISQLQKTIMFSKQLPPSHSRTLLIVAGAREQANCPWDLQLDALLEVVHQAIFNRWCVELWMWKQTAEPAILDMRDFYPPEVFSVLFLDNHREHIVTRVKRRPINFNSLTSILISSPFKNVFRDYSSSDNPADPTGIVCRRS